MSSDSRQLLAVLVGFAAIAPAARVWAGETPLSRAAAAARSVKVSGRLPLYFTGRPSVNGARLEPLERAPVVVELEADAIDVARLDTAGLVVSRRPDGTPVARGPFVAGWATPKALSRLAALPEVKRVVEDGAPFGLVSPLDVLVPEVQAVDVWRGVDAFGYPLTGVGQLACSVDVGIDVYHPMFFFPDGGVWAWRDVDASGDFTSGVDTLGSGVVLRRLKSVVLGADGKPTLDAGPDDFVAGVHYVYADVNGNGRRDFGPADGFDDSAPSLGEPLFVADDVNHNEQLDAGERLVGLGTSKVRVVNTGSVIHTRGINLSAAPREGTHHGTAASSILVGGQRGLSRFVGIAPDAELVMAQTSTASQLFYQTDFCLNQGARVILHEYALWQGVFLDGSSPLERVIDSTMKGNVAHVNPAGNLAGAQKFYKGKLGSSGTTDIALQVPAEFGGEPLRLFAFSLVWTGDDGDLAVSLVDGAGATEVVDAAEPRPFGAGLVFASDRVTSDRGTARIDIYVFSDDSDTGTLAPGSWTVRVTDSGGVGPLDLIATVQDDRSGWARGIHFPELANEDHLIGYPGTADSAIVVAAYTGHGFDGGQPGARAPYSGRGVRIDGLPLLSVTAPDDAIAAAHFPDFLVPFAPFGGTSGASPHVAGAAVLLQQAEPSSSGEAVRDSLRAGALADEYTGAVPNDDWGYGKLRIYRSLYGQDPPPGTAPTISAAPRHVDAGQSVTVQFTVDDAEDAVESLMVEIDANYDGTYERVLDERSFPFTSKRVGPHFVKLRVTDATGRSSATLARIDVHSTNVPSGGLACAVSDRRGALVLRDRGLAPRRGSSWWWLSVGLLCWRRSRSLSVSPQA